MKTATKLIPTLLIMASAQVAKAQNYMYPIEKYPTAAIAVQGAKAGTAYPKMLKENTRLRIMSLPSDTLYWPSFIKVEEQKKQKQGWYPTAKLTDRTVLIPMMKNFREEFSINAQLKRIAPNMNDEEVFVCSNMHVTKQNEKPSPWNEDYTMWGDERNFLLFYHDSLCTSQVATLNLFYYKPHYKIELVGADCNMPVTRQHLKESTYWDDNLEINWAIGTHTLQFAIKNNAQHTIHLLWDDMVMISDKSERVIHNGTNFEHRYLEQTNSVVARGTTYTDALLPVSGIYLNEQKGWMTAPIIKYTGFSPKDEKARQSTIGKEVKLLFVVEIDNHKYEYTFTLKITDVTFTLEKGSIDNEYLLSGTKM